MEQIFENYRIVREIGSGHFGTVYLAVGSVPGRGLAGRKQRVVAIKKLNNATPESIELLLREFSLLDQVKHRCIVRVFEYIEAHNAVVMEYIHGVNLRQVLDDMHKHQRAIFTDAGVEIGCEIADALYQAFTTPGDNGEPLQLVHRDLKPENIMLTQSGDIKILDFGLARVDNAEFTMDNGEIRGTPIYMAPEQARGQSIDHRTDLFSLGLILFELLMQEPAYQIPLNHSNPVQAVLSDIAHGRTSFDPNTIMRELPQLGPILVKVLQPKPSNRYANGQGLLVDMRRQILKEHGQSIREFAEYYFDNINPITAPPTLEDLQQEHTQSFGRSESKRKSSASERLKKMRDSQTASPPPLLRSSELTSPPVATPPNGIKLSQPSVSGSSGPNFASISPSTSGVQMSNDRKKPPIGGGASRSRQDTPPRPGRGPSPMLGARSPDETGMLKMAPLGQSSSGDSDEEGSETRFFTSAPPPSQGPPTSGQPLNNGPPVGTPPPNYGNGPTGFGTPPPANHGAPPPNYGYPQGLHQSQASMPPPQAPMGIGLGDAAGSQHGYGGTATPFSGANVQGNYVGFDEAEGRTGTMRVWVLLAAVVILIGLVSFISVWNLYNQEDVESFAANEEVRKQGYAIEPSMEEEVYEDPEPVPAAAPTPPPTTRRRSSTRRSSSSGNTASSGGGAASAPASGTLTVRVNSQLPVSELEAVCGGSRKRAQVRSGVGSFRDIPSGSCELFFKPTVAKYQGSLSGRSLNCTIAAGGATVSCN